MTKKQRQNPVEALVEYALKSCYKELGASNKEINDILKERSSNLT